MMIPKSVLKGILTDAQCDDLADAMGFSEGDPWLRLVVRDWWRRILESEGYKVYTEAQAMLSVSALIRVFALADEAFRDYEKPSGLLGLEHAPKGLRALLCYAHDLRSGRVVWPSPDARSREFEVSEALEKLRTDALKRSFNALGARPSFHPKDAPAWLTEPPKDPTSQPEKP